MSTVMDIDSAADAFMALMEPQASPEVAEPVDTETEQDVAEVEYAADSEDALEEGYDESDEFDESETDEEEVEEPIYTVKVDGKEMEVTLDELKRGFSGQRKIQLGMQEAAEARKAAQALRERTQQYEQTLSALTQQMQQQGLIAPPEMPSSELAQTDPFEYNIQFAKFNEGMKAYQAQQQQLQMAAQQRQMIERTERQALLEREMGKAREMIPELSDAKRAPEVMKKLTEFGTQTLGWTPEDLAGVTDHRALYTMHLAQIGYEALQGKQKAQQRTSQAKPVVKAGAKKVQNPKRKKADEAMKRVKRTGSIDDAVNAFLS